MHRIAQASLAITSELLFDKLVPTILRVVLENAGASRGAFLVNKEGTFVVEASADVSRSEASNVSVERERRSSLAEFAQGAESIVQSAAQSPQLHVAEHGSEQVLVLPLLFRGSSSGLLYLERCTCAPALTQEHLDALDFLSSQIAVALHNALAYQAMVQREAQQTEALAKERLQLETARAQLMQSEKMASLGRLTVGIAHEIKNPLNFINNFAQLNVELVDEIAETIAAKPKTLASEITDVLSEIRAGSDKIAEHGQRADSIVRGMMQHATGASGVRQAVDLNALLEDYVKLSYHSSRADSQPFELRLERDYDPNVGKVSVIVQDLARVFVNLFSNALYALGEKKRTAEPGFVAMLAVTSKREGSCVKITIRDNGTGVPEHVRAHIFDPFFTTKPGNAGTGLGLSLSRDIIVNGHGGTIELSTVLGEHTTFTITLPA